MCPRHSVDEESWLDLHAHRISRRPCFLPSEAILWFNSRRNQRRPPKAYGKGWQNSAVHGSCKAYLCLWARSKFPLPPKLWEVWHSSRNPPPKVHSFIYLCIYTTDTFFQPQIRVRVSSKDTWKHRCRTWSQHDQQRIPNCKSHRLVSFLFTYMD